MSTEREKEAIADNHLFSLHNMLQKRERESSLTFRLGFCGVYIRVGIYIGGLTGRGAPLLQALMGLAGKRGLRGNFLRRRKGRE